MALLLEFEATGGVATKVTSPDKGRANRRQRTKNGSQIEDSMFESLGRQNSQVAGRRRNTIRQTGKQCRQAGKVR